jgi:hypothetical protein
VLLWQPETLAGPDQIPSYLKNILANEQSTKFSVNMIQDRLRLIECKVDLCGEEDVAFAHADRFGFTGHFMGLSLLARCFLRLNVPPKKPLSFSFDSANDQLTEDQMECAAIDAILALALGLTMRATLDHF